MDAKGRRYLFDLKPGGSFQYHAGTLAHDELIGRVEGRVLRSSAGARLVAFRPRLADYILRMRRGPQVVYPKDIGPIIHWGDIGPGMTVLEAGTGSGALTLALLRAVGPEGTVVSVEERPDHADHARGVIERFWGSLPATLDLRVGDVVDVAGDVASDRVVLDLPEPWLVVEALGDGLVAGGVITCFVPTVPQVQRLQDELRRAAYEDITTFEVLFREWVAENRSVRPSHQMVGHTGFVTVGRRAVDADHPAA